jgi:hypothetical protein
MPFCDNFWGRFPSLSQNGVSVVYTSEEFREKVWNEVKTVVTLHRQSDKTSSERHNKKDL